VLWTGLENIEALALLANEPSITPDHYHFSDTISSESKNK